MVTSRKQMKPTSICARLLKQTDRTLEGLEVSYELLETATEHLIAIVLGVEVVFLLDTSGFLHARRVYDLLVRGGVTPCTAADVFEDLMHEIDE